MSLRKVITNTVCRWTMKVVLHHSPIPPSPHAVCVARPKQAQRPRVREYAAQAAEMSSAADESRLATGDLKALEQEMAALVQERKVQVRGAHAPRWCSAVYASNHQFTGMHALSVRGAYPGGWLCTVDQQCGKSGRVSLGGVQSAIWEEYKKEADALDKKLTKVLEDRRAKREELVRILPHPLASNVLASARSPPTARFWALRCMTITPHWPWRCCAMSPLCAT